jgi:hypothetical protein
MFIPEIQKVRNANPFGYVKLESIMNPGDLITEYSMLQDTFPDYNNLGIILERTGIFPNWLYKVLSQDSSIKIYRSGSIKRLQIFHENW